MSTNRKRSAACAVSTEPDDDASPGSSVDHGPNPQEIDSKKARKTDDPSSNCGVISDRDGEDKTKVSIVKQHEPCKWENYVPSLFNKEEFSDLKVLTKNKVYPAHRIVLAASSSKLESMINEQAELGNGKNEPVCLDMKLHKQERVLRMLQFIYSDKIPRFKSLPDALEMWKLTEMYGIEDLQDFCAQWIEEKLTERNALDILLQSDKEDLHDIRRIVLEFIKGNRKSVSNVKNVRSIYENSPKLFDDLMAAISENK